MKTGEDASKNSGSGSNKKIKDIIKVEPSATVTRAREESTPQKTDTTVTTMTVLAQTPSTPSTKQSPRVMKTEIGSGCTQTMVQVSVADTPCGNGLQRVIPLQMNSIQQTSTGGATPAILSGQALGTSTLQLQMPNSSSQTLNISGLQLQQVSLAPVDSHSTGNITGGTQQQQFIHTIPQQSLLQVTPPTDGQVVTQQLQLPVLRSVQQQGGGATTQQIQLPVIPAQALQPGGTIQLPIVRANSQTPQVPIVQQSSQQVQVPLIQAQAMAGNQFTTGIQVPRLQTVSLPKLQLPLLQTTPQRQQQSGQTVSHIKMASVSKPLTFTQVTQVNTTPMPQLLLTPVCQQTPRLISMPVNQDNNNTATALRLGSIGQVGGSATLQTVQALVPLNQTTTSSGANNSNNNNSTVFSSPPTAIGSLQVLPLSQQPSAMVGVQGTQNNTPAANTLLRFCSRVVTNGNNNVPSNNNSS